MRRTGSVLRLSADLRPRRRPTFHVAEVRRGQLHGPEHEPGPAGLDVSARQRCPHPYRRDPHRLHVNRRRQLETRQAATGARHSPATLAQTKMSMAIVALVHRRRAAEGASVQDVFAGADDQVRLRPLWRSQSRTTVIHKTSGPWQAAEIVRLTI